MRRRGVAIGVAVASSGASVSDLAEARNRTNSQGNLSPLPFDKARSGGYVGAARLDRLREALSERDLAIVRDVARLRLMTGAQLERLHFAGLSEASGPVVRRRVLGRLVRWGALATLERRIGGVRGGSSGLVYVLDVAGKRLMAAGDRPTRPSLPGERYVRHVLAVAEVYVDLVERSRVGLVQVDLFDAEPASWWPDGRGGRMKPDAHVRVSNSEHTDSWWLEIDLATEHLPTLKRKLTTYLAFYRQGQLGPDKIMPWVLISVPNVKRHSDIVRLIRQLPSAAENLFVVALDKEAADLIVRKLGQP